MPYANYCVHNYMYISFLYNYNISFLFKPRYSQPYSVYYISLYVLTFFFSRPSKVVRSRRSEEHLPSSKGGVSRQPFGGAKKPNAPSSSAAPRGGGGAKVIDSRGRGGGAAAGGRKNAPVSGGGGAKRSGRDKVCTHGYNIMLLSYVHVHVVSCTCMIYTCTYTHTCSFIFVVSN